MKKLRFSAFICAAAISAALFAGCSSGTEEETSSQTSSETSSQTNMAESMSKVLEEQVINTEDIPCKAIPKKCRENFTQTEVQE